MHAQNARVNKKAVLAALAEVQQQQMVPRARLIKAYFPALLNNAPLVGKYDDSASFEKGVGKARADEILAQTDDAMRRTETWLAQLNAYYQKEYNDAMAERHKLYDALDNNVRWVATPDYPAMLRGRQVIYMWEEGGHSVPEIMDSALNIIKEVQKANPGKRILFSPEQLIWCDNFPFNQSPLLNKTAYNQPAVRFAGEKMPSEMKSATNYENFWEQVSSLGVDIMTMDDYLIDTSWLYSFFKVGNVSIPYAGDTPEVHQDAYNRFRSSYYGVHQRNTQWDRYIRAVAPYYDVIIVYAGSAHYGLKALLDMPADKVLDVLIYKLVVEDSVRQWDNKTHQAQGTYNRTENLKQHERRKEQARKLQGTAHGQLQENGRISTLYIIIP